MTSRATLLIPCVVSALWALTSCNQVPVSSLEKTFSLVVNQTQGTGDPVKIDFLWVIDNSSSMCEEQVALSDNFSTFTELLSEQFDLDAQVAVVTMDMQCDPQTPSKNSDVDYVSRGAFNRKPAYNFPPGCQKKERYRCTTDSDCSAGSTPLDKYLYGKDPFDVYGDPTAEPGTWTCRDVEPIRCMVNPNGSVNSECQRRCETDEECQRLFGSKDPDSGIITPDERYICQKPSGNPDDWGCLLPPLTDGCPAELSPILRSNPQLPDNGDAPSLDSLTYFPCLATVGVNQQKCFAYEEGLAAAYNALDPAGPNHLETNIACDAATPCPTPDSSAWAELAPSNPGMLDTNPNSLCQSKGICDHVGRLECVDGSCKGPNYGFMRDDAYLVIVFVSDEDDCSAEGFITSDYHDQCALLDVVDKPADPVGSLIPVAEYVNKFKSLKSDPSRVIVASIAGDSVPPEVDELASIATGCATCAISGEACAPSYEIAGLDDYAHKCHDWTESQFNAYKEALQAALDAGETPPEIPVQQVVIACQLEEDTQCIDGACNNTQCLTEATCDDSRCSNNSDKICTTASDCYVCSHDSAKSCAEDVNCQACSTDADCRTCTNKTPTTFCTAHNQCGSNLCTVPEGFSVEGVGPILGYESQMHTDPQCTCMTSLPDADNWLMMPQVTPGSLDINAFQTDESRLELADKVKACLQKQYIASKSNKVDCYATTYACTSTAGTADWGTRYYDLAQRFGPNGIPTNICDAEGIRPALENIAEIIISIVNKVCLPREIADPDTLIVEKTTLDQNGKPSDVRTRMFEGIDGPYGFDLVPGGEDCKVGDQERLAIKFKEPPQTNEQVFVTYHADPQLDL